jgi:hypothetical protein
VQDWGQAEREVQEAQLPGPVPEANRVPVSEIPEPLRSLGGCRLSLRGAGVAVFRPTMEPHRVKTSRGEWGA